ncbi:4'-phosphopantetheinyl transferase family protein [Chitinophaga costaii]|uniref:4'-phosphopantetheinyl transferase family protein n=1 Tax=Chitinophaga costaii TaxID=1335309 RepID=UPI0013FD6B81|nr:4'-phosphopantetheinyl transferase superfamily protein [Chitinophaga costaii]
MLYALKKNECMTGLADIEYNSFGRPFIPGCVDFNISHAGHLVICGISDSGPVGVDIEYHQPVELTDFANCFSHAEWNSIQHSNGSISRFYEYWTAKEAILKANGCGLTDNLTDLEVNNRTEVLFEGVVWYLHKVAIFADYSCSVACLHPHIAIEVFPVEVLRHFLSV